MNLEGNYFNKIIPQTADKVLVVFNFIQICNIIKNILIYYIEVL